VQKGWNEPRDKGPSFIEFFMITGRGLRDAGYRPKLRSYADGWVVEKETDPSPSHPAGRTENKKKTDQMKKVRGRDKYLKGSIS